MNAKPKGFFAYPSAPERIGEILRQVAEDLNSTQSIDVRTWQDLAVGGRVIISEICEAIETSDIFVCELTYLNPNVLFELGYAIAKKKTIWMLLDTTIVDAKKEFDEFGLLTTIGYETYSNANDVLRKFFDAKLTEKKTALFDQLLSFPTQPEGGANNTLFYLKSLYQTDGAIKVTRRVGESALQVVMDDPREVGRQPFPWYAQQLVSAFGVISHFISHERAGHRQHNAKRALISGLAYGLQKKLLMLAEAPYSTPIDYKDLLSVANTAKECERLTGSWLKSVEDLYLRNESAWKTYKDHKQAHQGLKGLSIGDYVAENESTALLDYFVPTATYNEALNSQQTIFIGRKGSGKTANFFKLQDEFSKDRRNHVCVIKPSGYDLDGLVNVIRDSKGKAESGFLVESFWKFLIYSELTRSLYEDLQNRPEFYEYTTEDEELRNFCLDNESLIIPDFSSRLDSLVNLLAAAPPLGGAGEKMRVSEAVHSKLLTPMRELLVRCLAHRERVVVLIDNLDMAWRSEPSAELGELLWGLLAVTQIISQDINRHKKADDRIHLSAVLFLRSDIFYRLSVHAHEKDKVSGSKLLWNDAEKLFHVIEERFRSTIDNIPPNQIWEKYFCAKVKGQELKKYIAAEIIPRPRDMIFFLKAAIAEAVHRGHPKVAESDFVSAEGIYSQYALDSIFTEHIDSSINLQEICFRLIGGPPVLSIAKFKAVLTAAGIAPEKHEQCVALLRELTFLGFQVGPDDFRFMHDYADLNKLQVMAKRYAQESGVEESLMINRPFHANLEIASQMRG